MATVNSQYLKRFESQFSTTNNRIWNIEIYDRNWNGSGGVGTFITTDSGLVLKFDCEGDEKFAPIVGCKAELNFMVDYSDNNHAQFIDDLLVPNAVTTTYEEGDLYILIRENNASGSIIFCGEYLMDLDTLPDTAGEFPIQLTFTDGLGKLKEIEFEALNVDTTVGTYQNMGHKRFTYWISQVLQHTKKYKNAVNTGGFWDDASNKAGFSACVRWWNHDFYYAPNSISGLSCPLHQTKGQMAWATKINPSNGQVNTATAYEVLKQICRSWGMRVIYWNGQYWFNQIFEFNADTTFGTTTTPIDQYRSRWRADGSSYTYMASSQGGTGFNRFLKQFYNKSNPQHHTEKLEGSTYKFLPVLREVKTNLVHEGFQNIFGGFPQPNSFGTNFLPFMGGPFLNSSQYKYNCNLKIEITAGTHSSLTFGYTVAQFGVHIIAMNPATTPSLSAHALATLTFDPVANTYGWDDTPTYTGADLGPIVNLTSGNGPHTGMGTTSIVDLIPNLEFPGYRDAATDYVVALTSPVYVTNWSGTNINIQTGSPYGSSAICTIANPIDTSALSPPSWSVGLFNNFLSVVQPVSTNSATSNTVFINNQSQDSHLIDWGDVFWGDGPEYWDNSALMIQTGSSTFEFSDWTADNWLQRDYTMASNPPAGSGFSFNQILNHQMKQCQAITIKRANFDTVNNVQGQTYGSGKPFFINPLGVIVDCDVNSGGGDNNTKYMFRRGSFDVFREQWSGEWIETTVATAGGGAQAKIAGGGNLQGNGTTNTTKGGSADGLTAKITLFQTSESLVKNVAKTSLNIETPNFNIGGGNWSAKTGDKLYLTYMSGTIIKTTLTADITAESTSISFTSITPAESSYGPLMVQIPMIDMWEQSNRKNRGTMAGFDISATGMTKGGVTINTFLDSDTMTGASATSLSTSESIKAYVDSQSGGGGGLSLFSMLTCSSSTITTNTNGVANAVVMKFDTESISEGTATDIIVYGSEGESGVSQSSYSWKIAPSSGLRYFEFQWNVTSNTNTVNNRILSGIRLQNGIIDRGAVQWTDINPTTSYIYDRGNGTVRKGSGAGSIIIGFPASVVDRYFRMQFWRESASNAGVKAESVLNGTQISIKQLK